MLQTQPLKKGLIVLCSIFCLLFSTCSVADAPFFTDDPIVMKPGTTQSILFANSEFSQIINSTKGPALEFDYPVSENLEIDSYLPILNNANAKPSLRYLFPNQSGISDVSFELKYRFFQETQYLPAFSFGPNIFLPTGNAHRGLGNGRLWYYLPLSAHKTYKDWNAYAEIAYAVNSAPTCKNFFFAGAVLQKQITEKLILGTELYSQGASNTFNPPYTLLNIGGYYTLSPHFSLLGSFGHSITGQEVWMSYVGIAYT